MDNELGLKTTSRLASARRFYTVLTSGWLICALIFGAALLAEYHRIDENTATLARERGHVLFRLVELTRDWNAQHGGVYVRVSEQTQPNPYLDHPKRDLVTTEGISLTMVNPAFMTRQIAEIAEKVDGVKYHITSLNPIRPANRADPWETEALKSFEKEKIQEKIDLVDSPSGPVHRYMSPLLVKEPCLKCHSIQGYKLGEIRGGISISMPAEKLLSVRERQRLHAVITHLVGFALVGSMLHIVGWRSRRYFIQLQRISDSQEQLIAQRTRELSDSNASLTEEVAERRRNENRIAESEARYRSVIEAGQDAIFIIEAEGFSIAFANEKASKILGQPVERILGMTATDFIHPDDRSSVQERLARRARGDALPSSSRIRFVRPGLTGYRIAEVYISPIALSWDSTRQWVVAAQDITDQLSTERELQIAAAVMENAAEAIIVTDTANRIIQANPAFTAITGYRPSEVIGQDPKILASGRHDHVFFEAMWKALRDHGRWEGEIWNRRKDGTVYPQWLSITTIKEGALESGGRHVATFIDISQRKEAEELLRHKATSDPLTDLPNRALFYDRLQMALTQARRYETQFALLYLDLDHFKEVNDTLGHAAGDDLLVECARRLSMAIRDSDTVARLGGDEFAVILPKISGQLEAEDVAQRIVMELARPFKLDAGDARVSASVGVAIYPEHGEDMEHLKRHADMALYAVKEGGRNAYRVFSSVMKTPLS